MQVLFGCCAICRHHLTRRGIGPRSPVALWCLPWKWSLFQEQTIIWLMEATLLNWRGSSRRLSTQYARASFESGHIAGNRFSIYGQSDRSNRQYTQGHALLELPPSERSNPILMPIKVTQGNYSDGVVKRKLLPPPNIHMVRLEMHTKIRRQICIMHALYQFMRAQNVYVYIMEMLMLMFI